MILIAPDKFKGTLTAQEATNIIAECIAGPVLKTPMADGGEGTAEIIASQQKGWTNRGDYFYNERTGEAVIDSSAIIGLQLVDPHKHDILTATSAPLGRRVAQILTLGARKVIIAIGGTSTCDGGLGFYKALGPLACAPQRFHGLSDVRTDLTGAIIFAPQKGATDEQLPLLRARLQSIKDRYPHCSSPFDGAGGGLGFAIASLIGAPTESGAEYVLKGYNIPWNKITKIITGEGRIDNQTSTGKVVGTLIREAQARNIPVIAIGGCVSSDTLIPDICRVVDASRYLPDEALTADIAAKRLRMAVADAISRD